MKKTLRSVLATVLSVLCIIGSLSLATSAYEFTKYEDMAVGYVSLGSYPTRNVSDYETRSKLANRLDDDNWTSFGFKAATGLKETDNPLELVDTTDSVETDSMLFQDIVMDGRKYRAVKVNHYRADCTAFCSGSYIQNEYVIGNVPNDIYYFVYEDIIWEVSYTDEDTGISTLICKDAIDAQAFNDDLFWGGDMIFTNAAGEKANDYATSTVRAWLNGQFKETAFFADLADEIGNVELPSRDDIDIIFTTSDADEVKSEVTDYAVIMGIKESNDRYEALTQIPDSGMDARISTFRSDDLLVVSLNTFENIDNLVNATYYAVRPVIKVDLAALEEAEVEEEALVETVSTVEEENNDEGIIDNNDDGIFFEEIGEEEAVGSGLYSGNHSNSSSTVKRGENSRKREANNSAVSVLQRILSDFFTRLFKGLFKKNK